MGIFDWFKKKEKKKFTEEEKRTIEHYRKLIYEKNEDITVKPPSELDKKQDPKWVKMMKEDHPEFGLLPSKKDIRSGAFLTQDWLKDTEYEDDNNT